MNMSFYRLVDKYRNLNVAEIIENITEDEVVEVINKSRLDIWDFMKLLSPAGGRQIERMAVKAREESLKHFGKAILLYTPMYISNYCVNRCSYCGFNASNSIERRLLSLEEIDKEAQNIAKTGLLHILLLTGDAPKLTTMDYLVNSVKVLKKYFESVVVEIFAMTEKQYGEMIEAGVDGLAIYQETYDEKIYDQVHVSGPKTDFKFRLDAPERACKQGIRNVSLGALLGLADWRKEIFLTGIHGKYLLDNYPEVEYCFSFPRIKKHVGMKNGCNRIDDRNFVQTILALKLYLPYFGVNITTRETKELRKNLIPIGITKMSAGVSTEVGGHTNSKDHSGTAQFDIADHSGVGDIKKLINECGYQAVFKDWMNI